MQSRGPAGLGRDAVGVRGEIDTGAARDRATAMIDGVKQGKDLEPRPALSEPTVGESSERYWSLYAKVNRGLNTSDLYRGALENHIVPAVGDKPIGQWAVTTWPGCICGCAGL